VDLHLGRIVKVQEMMRSISYDVLLLGPTPNMFYFTGLQTSPDERLQLLIIPAQGSPLAVLPEMYLDKARSVLDQNFSIEAWSDEMDPFKLAGAQVSSIKAKRLAVDNTIRADHVIGLMKVLPAAQFDVAGPLTEALRAYKDEEEIRLMHEAGKMADAVMASVQNQIKPGLRERDLVAIVEAEYKKVADDISFKPIVASGPNGAQPHHSPGDRRLEEGDLVIIDCGALYKGYCSDITRTFCLGQATGEMKKVYQAVKDANAEAFKALEVNSSLSGAELDAVSRKVITDAGYGPYFIHRLGHGIGLEVHEAPYLVAGNDQPLNQGAAFTIEPGIYLSGKFGVRIEDVAVITEAGPRLLTAFSRDLVELKI
jgi:Xaa-Pro dipeptidase